MPDEAVALDLYFPDPNSIDVDVNEIKSLVATTGFQQDPHDQAMMGGNINFQPFEYNQENRELLEECVKQIENEFSELSASYEIKQNRDVGKLPAKQCTIKITNGN
jgi:hypothetical protein